MVFKFSMQDIIVNIIENCGLECIVKINIENISELNYFNKYPKEILYTNTNHNHKRGYINIGYLMTYFYTIANKKFDSDDYFFDTFTKKLYAQKDKDTDPYTNIYDNTKMVEIFRIVTGDSKLESEMNDIINDVQTYDFKVDVAIDDIRYKDYINTNNKEIKIMQISTSKNKGLDITNRENWNGRFEIEGTLKSDRTYEEVNQVIKRFLIDNYYFNIIDFIELKRRNEK
jgi:hypothetical protein